MKWLKRRLRNWINSEEDCIRSDRLEIRTSDSYLRSQGFVLQVYKASGGIVIETRAYDERKDKNNLGLYVIKEDQDVGYELGKIITYENLKL
jgi:hypothetical protein